MNTKTTAGVNSGLSLPLAINLILPLPVLALSGLLLVAASLQAQPTNGSGPSSTATNATVKTRPAGPPLRRQLTEVGPNYRLWTAVPTNSAAGNAPGALAASARGGQRHRLVAIATGMNYWDGQQWTRSDPSFVDTGDAFVANKVQHKVSLPANLNAVGSVNLTTPDGIVLRSTPVAIGLYDAASGQFLIIATLTNCAGTLVNSNQVVYPNAFAGSGVCADIVYHLERGSFEQDVVITGRLDPQDYGFPTNTTRIQILTEFYGAPEPDRIQHPIRVEQDPAIRNRMATPDLVDQVLGFGEFVLGAGRAVTAAPTSGPAGTGAPVVKEFKTIAGRTFLIESVEYGAVRKELDSLPTCSPKTASVPGPRTKAGLAYAAIPRPPQPGRKVAAGQKRTPRLLAKAVTGKSGLVIDYVATLGGSLYGTTVFQGDTTYFVSGAVYCNGPVTIEGGTVFKYPHASANACIYLNNTVTCATSAYCPAIFTAGDDENIGESLYGTWSGWTGTVTGYYANPALDVYYVNNTVLSNLRFNYAQEAVRFECYPYTGYYETVADSQLVDCVRGIEIVGLGSGSGTPGSGTGPTALTVNNTLLARIQYPLTASSDSTWSLYHCTAADQITCLASSSTASASFTFVNSVFANITTLSSGGPTLGGNYDGFYAAPMFGANVQTDTQSPFAPTHDGSGNLYLANGQGAYYLRDGSPFVNAGTANIGTGLKNDLAQRTTTPGEVLEADMNSTATLSQQPIRDTDTPDLGYHYPAVDYVINGVTVNNCTLNIDQGTVLGYQGYPYIWALRINAGGRLNVNGVPTNRVVFAHLEAIQESPTQILKPFGAMVAFRDLFFGNRDTPATPFPEAKFLYTDFLTVDGGYNLHVGPLEPNGFTMPDYANHACIANFVADGCRFQGGEFYYEDGGPPGRTALLRNSIFERVAMEVEDSGNYGSYTHVTEYDAQITAVNNLFYNCAIWLIPCSGSQGTAWTFTDNLFDEVDFNAYDQYGNIVATYNGPVGNNSYNGYVGMSTYLTPENQPATDPKLSSVSYVSGSLGRFYLPSTATALIDQGSRTASAAGLYHFTTQTSNAKEAGGQVDIGPHYLALVGGHPADSNGDGIPDFIADRNGDGIEGADEIQWYNPNSGVVAVLSPAPNSIVSGVIQVQVALGATPSAVIGVAALVDGEPPPGMSGLDSPAQSTGSIEIDTSRLAPGTHTLAVETGTGPSASNPNDQGVTSPSITFSVQNPVGFADWQNRAQLLLNVSLQVDPAVQNYTLHFFDSASAKATSPPQSINDYPGTANSGTISYSQPPANLGYGDASSDPTFYSFTEMPSAPPGTPAAVANKNIIQDPTFPCEGWWAAAYDDLAVDFAGDRTTPVYDPLDWQGQKWKHYDQLDNGWFPLGANANDGTCPGYPPTVAFQPAAGSDPATSTEAQTWPVRGAEQSINGKGFANDVQALKNILSTPSVRNFYGLGHGNTYAFFYLSSSALDCFPRYRFVFLDGCKTYSNPNFSMFGAVSGEVKAQQIAQNNFAFTDTTWYRTTGLRPAAFMGHITPVALFYKASDGTVRCIEAESNWHMQFLSLWAAVYGEELYQAKLDADRLAWINATGCSSCANPKPQQPEMPADKINGTPIWWSPVTCLKIAGYQRLKFNQINKAGDTW